MSYITQVFDENGKPITEEVIKMIRAAERRQESAEALLAALVEWRKDPVATDVEARHSLLAGVLDRIPCF